MQATSNGKGEPVIAGSPLQLILFM
jgi:hypothetical protein